MLHQYTTLYRNQVHAEEKKVNNPKWFALLESAETQFRNRTCALSCSIVQMNLILHLSAETWPSSFLAVPVKTTVTRAAAPIRYIRHGNQAQSS